MRRLLAPVLILATALSTLVASAQLPSPTFSGLTITPGITMLAPSTAAHSGLNLGAGVAPTSPNNGDVWTTSAGVFARVAGVTVGPFTSASAPCSTCATTTNGGPLSAAAPLAVSAGGQFTMGSQPFTAAYSWDPNSTIPVYNQPLIEPWVWGNAGTINTVTFHTGGSGSPSITFSVQVNGTNVPGCANIVVTSATDVTSTCTTTAISNGQKLTINVTATSGTPNSAWIQVGGTKPAS